MASSPDDVYRGDSADATTDPFASTSPAGGSNPDVYWGVDPSSPVSTSISTPAMGSSSDSYWGTPSVDLTV
jgi:hypothetical protein